MSKQIKHICPMCRCTTYADGSYGHGDAKLIDMDSSSIGHHSETYQFTDKYGTLITVTRQWSK